MKKTPMGDVWSRVPVKYVIMLSVNIILFLGIFLVAWDNGLELIASIVYGIITLAAALYYIIYNRGMIGALPKPEMLDPTWDMATRTAFLDDLRARRKKTKWIMTVLIPMIIVFAYKILDIAFFDRFSSIF